MLLVDFIKVFLFVVMQYHMLPNVLGILILSIGDLLDLATNLMFMAIIIVVIESSKVRIQYLFVILVDWLCCQSKN